MSQLVRYCLSFYIPTNVARNVQRPLIPLSLHMYLRIRYERKWMFALPRAVSCHAQLLSLLYTYLCSLSTCLITFHVEIRYNSKNMGSIKLRVALNFNLTIVISVRWTISFNLLHTQLNNFWKLAVKNHKVSLRFWHLFNATATIVIGNLLRCWGLTENKYQSIRTMLLVLTSERNFNLIQT